MTTSMRIAEFDVWRPGYGGAEVTVYLAGTTTPADLFSDEDLTVAADNPATLLTQEIGGIVYGKLEDPLYVGASYYLDIDTTDQTGVIRLPLTTLDGADAHLVTVQRAGQTRDTALEDVLARIVHVADFGALGTSSATNTATLTSAIGIAAAAGGGRVLVPAGTYPFTTLTLPAGVVLEGAAAGVTILQSQTADKCVTASGDAAGMARLTLDGVSLISGSTGFYVKALSDILLDDVEIMRFATGLHCRGGMRARWNALTITNCVTGAKLHGDLDASGDADGGPFEHNRWTGGRVQECTTIGVDLSYEDAPCRHNTVTAVGFEDNTGAALRINGARYTALEACWWSGNTTNIRVLDDDTTTPAARADNTVVDLRLSGGSIDTGASTFADTCQDILFDRMAFTGATFTATSAQSVITLRDCVSDSDVTINGVTRWLQATTNYDGAVLAFTTDAVAVKAWGLTLAPGQVAFVEAIVLANPRNGTGTCEYHIETSCRRPGSALGFDAQTANFTLGDVLQGATSGATGRITAITDNGASGSVTLRDISGDFIDNEIIAGTTAGGSATADGALVAQSVVLLGSVTSVRAAREDVAGRDVTFVATAEEIEVHVTGTSSDLVDWVCRIRVTV